MNAKARHSFEFGPFRLDLSERLLVRDGKAVPLAPKLFDTIAILVENSGHILEKDDLMKRLWPDTFVEESSLAQNIFQLRKILKERRSGRRYIETVPKRGYRFSADVREIVHSDDEADSCLGSTSRGGTEELVVRHRLNHEHHFPPNRRPCRHCLRRWQNYCCRQPAAEDASLRRSAT